MKLQTRLFVLTVSIVFLTFSLVVVLNAYRSKAAAFKSAEDLAQSLTKQQARQTEQKLGEAVQVANSLAQVLAAMKETNTTSRKGADQMLRNVLEQNPAFTAVWSLWEPNGFDGQDALYANSSKDDKTGAYMPVWARDEANRIVYDETFIYSEEIAENYYTLPKQTMKPVVMEPYKGSVNNKEVLMTSFVAPVLVNGVFAGVVGVDMSLGDLQEMNKSVSIYQTGSGMILTGKGIVVSAPSANLLGSRVEESSLSYKQALMQAVAAGGDGHEIVADTYLAYSPIRLGSDSETWTYAITVPLAEVTAESDKTLMITLATGGTGLLLVSLTIMGITRGIVRTVTRLARHAEHTAEGDFTQQLPARMLSRKDELGVLARAFAHISDNMNRMIGKIAAGAKEAAGTADVLYQHTEESNEATKRIVHSIDQIAHGSDEQASSAEESAKALQVMAEQISQVADTASVVQETSKQMAQSAKGGLSVISAAKEKMDDMMKTIEEGTEQVSSVVNVLHNDSTEISEILRLIAHVSDQTNLLSLNAAIEAARSGEAGRGFAVVADEIRKLAAQSQFATDQIQSIMNNIQSNTSKTLSVMETGKTNVESVKTLINRVHDEFFALQSNSVEVAHQVEELSLLSANMAANAEEVTAGIEEMATIARESASEVNLAARSSQKQLEAMNTVMENVANVKELSQELKQLIGSFQVRQGDSPS
ncbi:MAG: methyl-accepting chemotaxis protein [Clostridia bacterium]